MTLTLDTVTARQNALTRLGWYDGPVDGMCSPGFFQALCNFQRWHGLVPDGKYGPLTDGKLGPLSIGVAGIPASLGNARFMRITSYWVAAESDYPKGAPVRFEDNAGNLLYTGTAQAFAHAALEGTIKLKDGRLLNVDGHRPRHAGDGYDAVDAESTADRFRDKNFDGVNETYYRCWRVVKEIGVGYGSIHGEPHVQFQTCAADRNFIPFGTPLFLLERAGFARPDGHTSDGYEKAIDTGGAIRYRHLDEFCGTGKWARADRPRFCHVFGPGVEKFRVDDFAGLTPT